jgi:hypothetical protein
VGHCARRQLRRQREGAVAVVILGVCLLGPCRLRAQDAVIATLHPSGLIQLSRAGVNLATLELSAHGPGWEHVPQATAVPETNPDPVPAGKRQVVGSLTVPKTEDGRIRFTETVQPVPNGLRLEYDLAMTTAMKLNGLQFSVNLPVALHAGKEVLIAQLQGEPDLVSLPLEPQKGRFQLWSGQGAKIELAKGTDAALTIELRAATDVVVQDLRQWDNPIFEVRFPAIMEDPPRGVAAGDRLHLDLTVTFPCPVQIEGP